MTQQQLSVHIPNESSSDKESIRDRLFYIFGSLGADDLVELWKLTDTAELRRRLAKIGIIIA